MFHTQIPHPGNRPAVKGGVPIRIARLFAGIPGVSIDGDEHVQISSITFDSRNVQPGSLFVALRGGYADGHDFLATALEAGAVAALVETDSPASSTDGFSCAVHATNTRAKLAPISAAFYGHPSSELKVVGVTGTDGKTTTSFYLQLILQACGAVTGLMSTVSIRVPGQPERSSARQTTPESLEVQRTLREMVNAGAAVAIVETTSHALETHRVDSCRFDVGVVTNIRREHLDFHGSVENYRSAKAGLLRRVVQSKQEGKLGVAVLNADDAGCRAISSHADGTDTLWYSIENHPTATIRAESIVTSPDTSTFTLLLNREEHRIRLPLPGVWNVSNALAAVGAAHVLGCDTTGIVHALEHLKPVPGRLQSIKCGQPFSVIVDYAHTPESIKSVLHEARRMTNGRVLIAFGSAGERDIEKRPLQGGIAASLADYAVFTSEDPRFEDPERIISEIARGAEEQGAVRGVDFDCIEDRRGAVSQILRRAHPGDVVILAGKGHEQSMIYGGESRPWDEAQVAREALAELGFVPSNNEGNQA